MMPLIRRARTYLTRQPRRSRAGSPTRETHQLPLGALVRAAGRAAALLLIVTPAAFASTGGAAMPWDTPLQNLLSNLTGPTARALVVIAIVACGLLWAFTRNEEGLKRLGQIAFGGAIALGAVALTANLGFAGAVV
jgi:type IV secretory pathway VirB2 component (pilin)